MKLLKRWFLLLIAPILILPACKKDKNDKSATFYGTPAPLGQGTARSFVVMDAAGKPMTIGIKFSASSLTGLPSDVTKEWEYPLELPEQAKITGFDHLAIDWNPVGHEPMAIYGLPHFDFHYYRITKEEQAQVQPGADLTPVPANYIPHDYMSGVIAIPDMGVHWVDSLAVEFKGQKFTDTFIYGFYHGHLTFMEPMITTEYLSAKPDFKLTIKQPKTFEKSGYYPTVTHISYDNNTKEYTMALEGLKWSDAK